MMHLPSPRSIALLLVCVGTVVNADDVPLGIWSWKQETIETKTARSELLKFCEVQGIGHVDQHVSVQRDGDTVQIRNANKLAKLIDEAMHKNVSISALRGDRKMFNAKNHRARLTEVSALVDFNESLPDGVSLRGIKYDVEPYLTEEWKSGGESRERVMRDYLDCLTKIRTLLKQRGSNLELSVDVPFWWDKPDLALTVDGVHKAFVHHVQDRVDAISIMSYRRSAEDVMRLSARELNYSRTIGQSKAVGLGLNFRSASEAEKVTTFAEHPVSEFRSMLPALRKQLVGNEQVRCIMLHDYKALAKYVEDDPVSDTRDNRSTK